MKPLRIVCGAFLLWLSVSGTGWAQSVGNAQVSGVVRDDSGGVLPGVEITMTKTDTGAIRTAFTDSDGKFTLPNLPVGPYQLRGVLSHRHRELVRHRPAPPPAAMRRCCSALRRVVILQDSPSRHLRK